MIDTLRFARRMEQDGGLSREASIAIAEGLAEEIRDPQSVALRVTKADLDGAINSLRVELHREMRDLAWKMAGMLLAQGAGIVALVKLLPPAV
jgi:hypothetical protein